MINSKIVKAAAIVAGFSMAITSAMPVGAVTVADLQAQIAALMAQLSSLQGGSATVSVTFTRDLTVGSSGADVTALQQLLVSKGYLTMPNGVAYGYFGNATKAALARWQAASGISPAAGYFGAKSRAAVNAAGGTTTGGTTTGGTTTGGTTTGGSVSGTITTPGAEGTIAVTQAPVSNTVVYENDKMDPVLAFTVKATGSDVAVQRVKVDLGATTNPYNKIFQTLYVVDDSGKTLASLDMNSTNVVKDGTDYYATLTGFSSIVSKGAQRTYTVKADIRSSIDTTVTANQSAVVTLPVNGVRAVDGAGIDLYGPGTLFSQTVTTSHSLASSATLTVSADPANPLAAQVVASQGSNNNQLDKLALLVFDVKADKDDVKLTDVNSVAITAVGGTGATASTSYLIVGNGTTGSVLGSATVSAGAASFNNLSYVIPKGTTATFTIAADIRSANSAATTITATVTGSNVLGMNTVGDTITGSGSATGNSMVVTSAGPVFSIIGTPTITKSSIVSGQNSTSTAAATFNIKVQALGADVYLGDTGSTTAPIASSTTGFQVYRDGAAVTLTVSSSTVAQFDSNFVSLGSNSYKLAQNNSGTVTLTFTFKGADSTNAAITFGNYAVGLSSLKYVTSGAIASQTFMSGLTAWRTPTVVMP